MRLRDYLKNKDKIRTKIRTKKTAPAGVRAVLMGRFREIRMKKTAPRGSIKDKKDRATWCESGADGSP